MNAAVVTPEGQNVIDIKLRRHQDGVRVRVWVDPTIERFFERWGGGEQEDVRGSGRLWSPYVSQPELAARTAAIAAATAELTAGRPVTTLVPPSPSIQLWSIPPQASLRDQDGSYTLVAPGFPLTVDGGAVNLTLIRIVGASSPEGAEFLVDAVVSRSELERIASKLRRASEVFYAEYVQPVGTRISLSTQPIQKLVALPETKSVTPTE